MNKLGLPPLSGHEEDFASWSAEQAALTRACSPARLAASGETRLPVSIFPQACPCPVEQILDPNVLPDS